jgi:hypothetical protein
MKFFIFLILVSFLNHSAHSSDHVDGPVAIGHGIADISDLYAFKTPGKSGHLSVVLNIHPFVSASGHFSEKVDYVVGIRKAKLNDKKTGFETFDDNSIRCSFKSPHGKDYRASCELNSGPSASAMVGQKKSSGDFKLFAGMVSDPFFLDEAFVGSILKDGKLSKADKKENLLAKLNVLTIVLELDLDKVFNNYQNEMVAVTAKSITQDFPGAGWRQVDWKGRPEVTNYTINPNGSKELRDLYNQERPFSKKMEHAAEYRKRILTNITDFFDGQDGKKDWTKKKANQLTSIILRDYIVVAPNLPCEGPGYMNIEYAIMNGTEINHCGGRKLTDDISDRLLSWYLTGKLDTLDDGVDGPYRAVSNSFPYMAEPDTSVSARLKAWIAKKFAL